MIQDEILDFIHYLRYHAIPKEYSSGYVSRMETRIVNKHTKYPFHRIAYTCANIKAIDIYAAKQSCSSNIPKDADLVDIAKRANRVILVNKAFYGKGIPWGVKYVCYRPIGSGMISNDTTDDYDMAGRKYMLAKAWMPGFHIVRVHGPLIYLTCDTLKNEVDKYTLYASKLPASFTDISFH
jgi:hypothetical protein